MVHRDETHNLLEYLWRHPPSWVDLEEEERPKNNFGAPSFGKNDNGAYSNQQQIQINAKVDTETTKNAIRLAQQAREMGVSTLAELTLQAEQIDRIENNVESIHGNIEKSNRLLRGIESVPGSIANSFTKDIPNKGPAEFKDRTVRLNVLIQVTICCSWISRKKILLL